MSRFVTISDNLLAVTFSASLSSDVKFQFGNIAAVTHPFCPSSPPSSLPYTASAVVRVLSESSDTSIVLPPDFFSTHPVVVVILVFTVPADVAASTSVVVFTGADAVFPVTTKAAISVAAAVVDVAVAVTFAGAAVVVPANSVDVQSVIVVVVGGTASNSSDRGAGAGCRDVHYVK